MWEVVLAYLPPQTRIHGRAAANDAPSHHVDVGARDASGVDPDLVAEAGDVEAGQIRIRKPLRLDS